MVVSEKTLVFYELKKIEQNYNLLMNLKKCCTACFGAKSD